MLHFLNQWILPFSETIVGHFLFSNGLCCSSFPLENRSNQRRTTSFSSSKSINLTTSNSFYSACCRVDVMEGAWSYHRPTSLPVLGSYPSSLTQRLLQLSPLFPTWSVGTSSLEPSHPYTERWQCVTSFLKKFSFDLRISRNYPTSLLTFEANFL